MYTVKHMHPHSHSPLHPLVKLRNRIGRRWVVEISMQRHCLRDSSQGLEDVGSKMKGQK